MLILEKFLTEQVFLLINIFFIYSFIGYIWEVIFLSLEEQVSELDLKKIREIKLTKDFKIVGEEFFTNKKLITNRGYVRGFCPIYACCAFIMLSVLKPFQDNIVLLFFCGMFLATTIELITGLLLAKFGISLWEYHYRFSYKNIISLYSSIFWGIVTVLLFKVFNPYIVLLSSYIPSIMSPFLAGVLVSYYLSSFLLF